MNKPGFGLVEIVIASSIVSISVFSLSAVSVIANRLSSESLEKIRANFLTEEGIEAMRFLRDKSWSGNLSSLSPGVNYYLNFSTSTSKWSVGVGASAYIDSLFNRKITVENVSRDLNYNIVLSGGTNDPDTKKITVKVAWQERGATSTLELATYLSDIFDN